MSICEHKYTYRKIQPPHVGEYCSKCHAWLRWVPLDITYEEAQNFEMPFGKHAGKRLHEIPAGYLEWLSESTSNKSIKRKVDAFLDGPQPKEGQ